MKNSDSKGCRFAYGSMLWKVCEFWHANRDQLYKFIEEDEIKFITQVLESKASRMANLTMYTLPL